MKNESESEAQNKQKAMPQTNRDFHKNTNQWELNELSSREFGADERFVAQSQFTAADLQKSIK